jgi:iron complex transport system permease protein
VTSGITSRASETTHAVGIVSVRSSPWRRRTTTAVALAAIFIGVLFSASLGEMRIPLTEVVRTLAGGGDPISRLIVMEFRLPRVMAAVVVGAALGMSGALLQAVARNPLASPDLLGINAGASVAAVAVVITAGSAGGVSGSAASLGLPAAALVGALVSGWLLHVLAIRGRRLDPMRLVVVGVGLSAAGASLVSWLLTLGDVAQVGPAISWLAGSLHAATWPRVSAVAWALALCAPMVLVLARRLDPITLGDDAAAGLGIPVDRTRVALLGVSTVLAGAAVSVAGVISFVALAAPQVAQRLSGATRPPLLAGAAVGSAALVWSDLLARMGLSWLGQGAIELPVGVLTAALGAPYLLYVVARQRALSGEDT